MRAKILIICTAIAAATATMPTAQASGCMTRPDGTRHCSANGGYADFGGGGRKSSEDYLGKSNDSRLHGRFGEAGYRLPPFGRGQSGLTCYNIVGKPYTYRGGPRCPIS